MEGVPCVSKDLIALVAAIGGWVVALVTLGIGYVERKATRQEDLLGKTLGYFDGGSQRRSIGISLLEGIWIHKSATHPVIVPLIANQIVYLLHSTESRDAHNERNLVRLVTLLQQIPDLQQRYHDRWADVCDSILQKLEDEDSVKGIFVPSQTLKIWSRQFGRDLDS
jgi:hypothetical protein